MLIESLSGVSGGEDLHIRPAHTDAVFSVVAVSFHVLDASAASHSRTFLSLSSCSEFIIKADEERPSPTFACL